MFGGDLLLFGEWFNANSNLGSLYFGVLAWMLYANSNFLRLVDCSCFGEYSSCEVLLPWCSIFSSMGKNVVFNDFRFL